MCVKRSFRAFRSIPENTPSQLTTDKQLNESFVMNYSTNFNGFQLGKLTNCNEFYFGFAQNAQNNYGVATTRRPGQHSCTKRHN